MFWLVLAWSLFVDTQRQFKNDVSDIKWILSIAVLYEYEGFARDNIHHYGPSMMCCVDTRTPDYWGASRLVLLLGSIPCGTTRVWLDVCPCFHDHHFLKIALFFVRYNSVHVCTLSNQCRFNSPIGFLSIIHVLIQYVQSIIFLMNLIFVVTRMESMTTCLYR